MNTTKDPAGNGGLLPTLPEPFRYGFGDRLYLATYEAGRAQGRIADPPPIYRLYTADQMRAYAIAALEARPVARLAGESAGEWDLQALAVRFCGWPLPDSVFPDGAYPAGTYRETHGRPLTGTNLLSVEEAKAMLEYVLHDRIAADQFEQIERRANAIPCPDCGRNCEVRTVRAWACPECDKP